MMPACTGLPPGELMRSTTACAPSSSKARSAATMSSALASVSAEISPASPPARCAAWARCGLGATLNISPSTSGPGQAQPGQAEKHAPAALGALLAQQLRWPHAPGGFDATSPTDAFAAAAAMLPRLRCVGARWRGRVAGVAEGGRAVRAVHGGLSAAPGGSVPSASKGTGRMSREGYQYTCRHVQLGHGGEPCRGRRGRRRSGRRGLVAGAVDAAQDPALVHVEELAGLPVQLGRHMRTAVQVGTHRPSKRSAKARMGLAATPPRPRPRRGRVRPGRC
jgi:hypothetical protein